MLNNRSDKVLAYRYNNMYHAGASLNGQEVFAKKEKISLQINYDQGRLYLRLIMKINKFSMESRL